MQISVMTLAIVCQGFIHMMGLGMEAMALRFYDYEYSLDRNYKLCMRNRMTRKKL